MRFSVSLHIFFLGTCLVFLHPFCYAYNTGYAVQELNSTGACFESEVSTYTLSLIVNSTKWSICNGTYLLGGYNILGSVGSSSYGQYFQKNFSNLALHNMAYLSITMYKLDSWDSDDDVKISLDSKTFATWGESWQDWPKIGLCGRWDPDMANYRIFARVAHSTSTLTLKIIMETDETSDNESAGFRDINLLFANTANPIAMNETICAVAPIRLPKLQCQCPEGQYATKTICRSCDALCTSCFGSSVSECYQCAPGAGFDGISCVLCHKSCSICHGPGNDQCDQCRPGKVLIYDKYCVDTAIIPDSFSIFTNNCSHSYSVSPCNATQYIYINNSCRDSCDLPLVQATLSSAIKTCSIPCSEAVPYYSLDYQKCILSCVYPYKIIGADLHKGCQLQISLEESKLAESTASLNNKMTKGVKAAIVATAIFLSSNPTSISAAMLAKMIQYIKFMDFNRTATLERIFQESELNVGFLFFAPELTTTAESRFKTGRLPILFERFILHTSFIINFWNGLMSFGITFSLLLLITLLSLVIKKYNPHSGTSRAFHGTRLGIQNFLLTQFYSCYVDFVFFCMLDLLSLKLETIEDIMSLVIGLVFNVFGAVALLLYFLFLKNYQKVKQAAERNASSDIFEKFIQDREGINALFSSYKDRSLLTQSFLLILTTRNVIFSLTVTLLYKYPSVQAIIIVLMSIFMMSYLLFVRPFISIMDFLQQLSHEVILLVLNISLLSITLMDHGSTSSRTSFRKLNQTIIGCNTIISFIGITFIGIKCLMLCIKYFKDRKKKGKVSPVINTLPGQTLNMSHQIPLKGNQNGAGKHGLNDPCAIDISNPNSFAKVSNKQDSANQNFRSNVRKPSRIKRPAYENIIKDALVSDVEPNKKVKKSKAKKESQREQIAREEDTITRVRKQKNKKTRKTIQKSKQNELDASSAAINIDKSVLDT